MKALWDRLIGMDAVKFGVVGIISTGIDVGVLAGLSRLGASHAAAVAVGYMLGAVNGYLMNNFWTYSRLDKGFVVGDLLKYVAISLIGLGLTEVIVLGLNEKAGLSLLAAKLVAVILVFVWNYVANRRFTFVEPALDARP